MGTMPLAMLFVYNPTVLRKRFVLVQSIYTAKPKTETCFGFFKIDYGLRVAGIKFVAYLLRVLLSLVTSYILSLINNLFTTIYCVHHCV